MWRKLLQAARRVARSVGFGPTLQIPPLQQPGMMVWAIAMAEARATHKPGDVADGRHTSAGVAMCAPAHHGDARAAGHASWDASPP